MALHVVIWCVAVTQACHMHRAAFPILRVVDGDTVSFAAPFLPAPLNTSLSLRVRGIDCPGMHPYVAWHKGASATESGYRAKCEMEATLAAAATNITRSLIDTHSRSDTALQICAWDKYGARVLGDVVFWSGDGVHTSLADVLVHTGHAVPYTGHVIRHDWCASPAVCSDATLDG